MGRQEGIDAATNGDILPIEDFWSEEEVNHILPSARRELGWGGKLWLVPEYMDPWHMIYNKKIFEEAGLDPETPPETWADFMEMGDDIVAAGYIPMSNGWLDGFNVPWWLCLVGLQSLDDPSDIHAAVLGEASFAEPKHLDCWKIIEEATQKGYFNEDQASLDFISGIDLFSTGEVAMVMVVQPMVRQYVDLLGEDVVGVMKTPEPYIQGELSGAVPIPAMPLALAANAPYTEVAADVLRFIHTADRVNALYAHSTAMQANDLFDPTLVTDPRDQKIAQWFLESPSYTYNWHYTPQIEGEAFTIGQLLVAGEITYEEAGQMMDEAAAKWREDNPEMVEVFRDVAEDWASQ
jgi:multiple sugar transport system substrate-binding protein